jgi:2-polyprenyl-3-methyl-5-hydroxy-6-metoxy-1,4-benzoquinol methylase
MKKSAAQEKWDQRYQNKSGPGKPCWLLEHHSYLLPTRGRSLDLACGLGGNAIFLAAQGLESHGWDCSSVALEKLVEFARIRELYVTTQHREIEQHPPEKNSFDIIVVSQFLSRPIMPALVDALTPGGLLFYQTFNRDKQSKSGPSNAEFLLANNELLTLLSPLEVVFYQEDRNIGRMDQGLRDFSYFVGRKPV